MHVLNLGSFLTKDQPVYLPSTWNTPCLFRAKHLIIVHWANGLPPALVPWHSTEQIQEGPSPASVSPNQRSRLSIIITMSQATNLSSFHVNLEPDIEWKEQLTCDSHPKGFPQWVCLQRLSEGSLWQTTTAFVQTWTWTKKWHQATHTWKTVPRIASTLVSRQ